MNIIFLWLGSALWLGSLVFTLLRLAYDEWQQRRAFTEAAKEDRQDKVRYATWKPVTM